MGGRLENVEEHGDNPKVKSGDHRALKPAKQSANFQLQEAVIIAQKSSDKFSGTFSITSLPKVILEEGRVAALSHTYAVKSPYPDPIRRFATTH